MCELVSVIIPVYNGERFLAEALQSIFNQEHRPLEVIVVDDGSADQSAAVAATFPEVRVLRTPHRGVAATLNRGLQVATGELLAFLDADDRWLPGKLLRQVAELNLHPEVDMVFGGMRQFTTLLHDRTPREIRLSTHAAPHKSTMLVRRAAFGRVGEFSEERGHHDFLEWHLRATALGLKFTIIDDVMAERRFHDRNTGRTDAQRQRSQYLSTLRTALQQRRQAT